MYVYICICQCMCVLSTGAREAVDSVELELPRVMSHPVWELGTKHKSSGRVTRCPRRLSH